MATGNVVEKMKSLSKECYGCGACEQSCSYGAITMKNSDDGFLYPEVDYEKCVECGLCVSVCQCMPKQEKEVMPKLPDVYMAMSVDLEKTNKCSSGGGILFFK